MDQFRFRENKGRPDGLVRLKFRSGLSNQTGLQRNKP